MRTVSAVAGNSLNFGALHTSSADSAGLYLLLAAASADSAVAVPAITQGILRATIVARVAFNRSGVLCAWLVTL